MNALELRNQLFQAILTAHDEIAATRKTVTSGLEYAELTGKLDILSTLTDFLKRIDASADADEAKPAKKGEKAQST